MMAKISTDRTCGSTSTFMARVTKTGCISLNPENEDGEVFYVSLPTEEVQKPESPFYGFTPLKVEPFSVGDVKAEGEGFDQELASGASESLISIGDSILVKDENEIKSCGKEDAEPATIASNPVKPGQVDFIPVEKWYFCRYEKCMEMFYTIAQLGNHFLGSHPGVKLEVPSPKDLTMKGVLQGVIVVKKKSKPKPLVPAPPEAVSNEVPESLAAPSSRLSRQVIKNLKCGDPHPKRAHRILETVGDGGSCTSNQDDQQKLPKAVSVTRKRRFPSKQKVVSKQLLLTLRKSCGEEAANPARVATKIVEPVDGEKKSIAERPKSDSSCKYSCPYCPFQGIEGPWAESHRQLHEEGAAASQCPVCGWFVRSKSMAVHHSRRHADIGKSSAGIDH